MTREDKQVALQDLCARLPYGVIGEYSWKGNEPYNRELTGSLFDELKSSWDSTEDSKFLPYLRPMSSITEEEQKILEDFGVTISPFLGQMHIPFDEIEFPFITMQKIISYLYSIHIDINGLIPKGLAIEVTEDDNPYKD